MSIKVHRIFVSRFWHFGDIPNTAKTEVRNSKIILIPVWFEKDGSVHFILEKEKELTSFKNSNVSMAFFSKLRIVFSIYSDGTEVTMH